MPPRIAFMLCCFLVTGLVLALTGQEPPPDAPSTISSRASALIVAAHDRPPVTSRTAPCGWIRFLVNSEDTAGAFSMVESNECGKPITELHRHPNMDESFYVIEGTLTVYADGKTHTLGPGSYFFVPRGVPHAQGNPCRTANRVLITFTPGGFERFLKNRNEVLETTTLGSPEFQAAMAARGHRGAAPGGGGGQNNLGKAPVSDVACPPK